MEQIFKKDKLLNYSDIEHIKPIRIIIHNDTSETIEKLSDEDLEYNKLNENYENYINIYIYTSQIKLAR